MLPGKPSRETAGEPGGVHRDFQKVIDAFSGEEGVEVGRLFASQGLKVEGKIFAMFVKGALVLKLEKARVDALVSEGVGVHFDPGHGRL